VDRFFQPVLPIFHANEFDCRTDKISVRGYQVETVDLSVYRYAIDRLAEDQRLIQCPAGRILGKAKSAGGVSLWIGVDDQRAAFVRGERRAEVYSCSGFSNATFLVGDGNDSSQRIPQFAA
jgi:hypothetical protein